MKTLNQQDLHDILHGCAILGTGGGGSLEKGLKMVDEALAMGKSFKLVDFSEVPDEAWIATPYMCGSISPTTPELEAQYAGLPVLPEPQAYLAYRAMEEYYGKEFYGVISTELGGGNTAEAFYAAALLDRYIIDADPAGRSVPELSHSTYFINNLPIYPVACANEFGDVAILPKVVNDFRAEALVRAMAVASKNRIGVTDHPAQAKVLREAVIHGAISFAWKIGRIHREARAAGSSSAAQIVKDVDGFMLFKGVVSKASYETVEGFTVGDIYITGEAEYQGNEYHIWYKNEHMASWKDGKIDITVPDLICVFDENENEPLLNPHIHKGIKVSVIGLPAPEQWRTARGIEIFGPRYFGIDADYLPIEEKYRE